MKIKTLKNVIVIVCLCLLITPIIISNNDVVIKTQAKTKTKNNIKIKLNKTPIIIKEGKTYKIKIKSSNKKIKFSTSNKNIATVNTKGKIIAKKSGVVTITAKANKTFYKYNVIIKGLTELEKISEKYKDELADAKYKYISENTFLTINQESTLEYNYFLTHVIIDDAKQISSGLSYNTFGGERQKPTSNSIENNWILGINGSYFSYETGKPGCAGIFIKNGQLMQGEKTNGNEICLDKNGKLFTPKKGMTYNKLINLGVKDIFGTMDPVLISDGQKINLDSNKNNKYPRTAIGIVKPCEYYIITAGDYNYQRGLTFKEIQEIFYNLNCTYARSLDGGGSSSLVFKNQLINHPAQYEERAVTDFLYFTE